MVVSDSGLLLVGSATALYRVSADGSTFAMILPGLISDLKRDSGSPNIVYAAVAGSGIFKSTDGGATFAATPMFAANSQGLPTGLGFGGIVFAQSTQPTGNTFYAAAILTAGQPLLFCGGPFPNPTVGLFKSIDSGRTWSQIRQGPELPASLQLSFAGGQVIGYDLTLGVDPQNASTFYYGLRGLYAATDGGASGLRDNQNPGSFGCPPTQDNRIDNTKGHSDHHALAFSPATHFAGTPTRIYLGNDGGLISTANLGASYSYLNNGLATVLLRWLDIGRGSKANNAFSYGTAQDNGLFSHTPAQQGAAWVEGSDSDGSAVAVDPFNPRHAIGADNISFYTTSNGTNWQTNGQVPAGASPITFDPNGQNAYAASGQTLYRSTDNAATFSVVNTFSTTISSIGHAKTSSNTLWIGLNDGTVQFTNSALAGSVAWASPATQPRGIPGQAVTSVAVDPTNPKQIVVVYPGFSNMNANVSPTRHVFMTRNAGNNWSDISGRQSGGLDNLPDLPLYSVVIVPSTTPHTIVVAGDGGVFQSADLGRSWQKLGSGLPNAQMQMLALDSSVKPILLRVGSWGRGVFELTVPSVVPTGDPALIKGDWVRQGSRELLVPQQLTTQHLYKDTHDQNMAWHMLRTFGYPPPPDSIGPTPRSVSFIQSNFKADGRHGDYEAIVRLAPPIATDPDTLDFWSRSSKTLAWIGPSPIRVDNQPIAGVTGNPVLLQSNWGNRGNFELLVPQGKIIKQYFRNNDDPALAWHFIQAFGYPARPGQLGPTPRSVSFIQSNFKGDGIHGDFEAIVRVAPAVASDPDTLDYWHLDSSTGKWTGPTPVVVDDRPITGVTGDPIMLQSNWGSRGNFELLVPQGNLVKQYFRNNDDTALAWQFVQSFGYPAPPGQLGPAPRSISFIQSNFKGDGVHGNFEAIVRVAPAVATDPDSLDSWYLDSSTGKWNGPFPLLAN